MTDYSRLALPKTEYVLGQRWTCKICNVYSQIFETEDELVADWAWHHKDSIRHEILRRWLLSWIDPAAIMKKSMASP